MMRVSDAALPHMSVLLDADAMAPVLHRSLGPDAPIPEVRIHHIRYQAGRKLLVRYDVGLDGRRYDAVAMIASNPYLARRALRPENVAFALRFAGRSPALMPLYYEPDLDALIHWYPLDLELPALADPPMRLLEELDAAGLSVDELDGEPVTLAYMPRRRAVLRVGQYVVKLYANPPEFLAAVLRLRAARSLQGVRTAALMGQSPARLITVQPLLAGANPSSPTEVAAEAGELLRELQAIEAGKLLPEAGAAEAIVLGVTQPSRQLAIAEASAKYVAAILPDLGGRLEALLRKIEVTTPSIDSFVLTHGDFSARQLLVSPDGLAVVDWDAMSCAPAALDAATYAAHLVSGEADDLETASAALEVLLEGYGDRPAGLAWYFATCILRHSRYPFRYFVNEWPERTEAMVTAAEAALSS